MGRFGRPRRSQVGLEAHEVARVRFHHALAGDVDLVVVESLNSSPNYEGIRTFKLMRTIRSDRSSVTRSFAPSNPCKPLTRSRNNP